MKVAVDARMMTYTGIGRYVENLVKSLSRLYRDDRYSVLIRGKDEACCNGANLEFKVPSFRIPVYSLREQVLTPLEIFRLNSDISHYPSFNMPLLSPAPSVVTIHDLIYYLDRAACPNAAAHYYARFMFKSVAARARKIITVSRFSKDRITECLGVDPKKVTVIHNGVDSVLKPAQHSEVNRVKEKYRLNGEYLFYVGNHSPRKNILCLARAFTKISGRVRHGLVLAGKKDPRWSGLYEAVADMDPSGRVRFIGDVPQADLPALYSGASLFVFPSRYEGFGLPPLEAMACGTPVITSNLTSLPEVVGDAAITIDPDDADALSRAILRALESNDLRCELREKGVRRAALFSWDNAARMTRQVYEEVLSC